MTHRSPACERLRFSPLSEIGIHPNFLQGTTQGKNPAEIMKNLLREFPSAKSVRTHGMVYSASIAHMFAIYGLDVDSSIFLGGMKGIQPLVTRYNGSQKILRVPYYWSDDGNLFYNTVWSKNILDEPGLKVLCFHPTHVFLNTCCWKDYLSYKDDFQKGGNFQDVKRFINTEKYGAMNFLIDIALKYDKEGKKFGTFQQLREEYLYA
jgi:hypothetical protein